MSYPVNLRPIQPACCSWSNQTTCVHMCCARHAHQLHCLPIQTPWPARQVWTMHVLHGPHWCTCTLDSDWRLSALSCPSHVKGDSVRRQMHCMQSRQRSLKQTTLLLCNIKCGDHCCTLGTQQCAVSVSFDAKGGAYYACAQANSAHNTLRRLSPQTITQQPQACPIKSATLLTTSAVSMSAGSCTRSIPECSQLGSRQTLAATSSVRVSMPRANGNQQLHQCRRVQEHARPTLMCIHKRHTAVLRSGATADSNITEVSLDSCTSCIRMSHK